MFRSKIKLFPSDVAINDRGEGGVGVDGAPAPAHRQWWLFASRVVQHLALLIALAVHAWWQLWSKIWAALDAANAVPFGIAEQFQAGRCC